MRSNLDMDAFTTSKTLDKKSLLIVSPALADANNGNWQTAKRWAGLLSDHYDVSIERSYEFNRTNPNLKPDVLLALHARRSADSIEQFAAANRAEQNCPALVLALTGTDLYKDIHEDAKANHSLTLANSLIVLQEKAMDKVPAEHIHKTHTVFQSCSEYPTLAKPNDVLKLVVVGHLRDVKMPQTIFEAACLLKQYNDIEWTHIGDALDTHWGQQALATQQVNFNYHWLGNVDHERVRHLIQQAHVLIHPSQMEGGAHVIMEAVRSGTPVIASYVDGNVGMLGNDYLGYFPLGDANALVNLIMQLHANMTEHHPPADVTTANNTSSPNNLYQQLRQQCAARAPLFTPINEKAALLAAIEYSLEP